MRFVKLHTDDDRLVFVNPESVEKVCERGVRGGGSIIVMHHGAAYVSEEVEEVMRILEECPKP